MIIQKKNTRHVSENFWEGQIFFNLSHIVRIKIKHIKKHIVKKTNNQNSKPTHHSVICRLFFPLFFHSYRCFQKHFRPFFFLVTCSINAFINNFTDIQFPDHTVYPFKVYNSVVLKIFTNLCNHLCIPTPEHIHHPKKKPPACQ